MYSQYLVIQSNSRKSDSSKSDIPQVGQKCAIPVSLVLMLYFLFFLCVSRTLEEIITLVIITIYLKLAKVIVLN